MASAAEEDVIPGLEDPNVVTKYKLAGEIATKVTALVKAACVAGAKTIDMCQMGDDAILEETGKIFNKKNADGVLPKKGVAFPTCICVNNCVCHNSPLPIDDEIILAEGDLVKIDLAVHLDGYIAPCATTFIVGGAVAGGRAGDAILAAHKAAEVALRMLRPGTKSYAITDAITKVADAFNCKPLEGMLSHEISRNKIDGEKAIIQAPTPALRKEHKEFTVGENEVYALDIIMSTGAGKPKDGAQRTTVYKKNEGMYSLKMKASKQFYFQISKDNSVMPFTLRSCPDSKTARLGVTECVKHNVVDEYKILWEEKSDLVAQFKMLVLVMPNGNIRGTTTGFDEASATSECGLDAEADAEMISLLATTVGTKNKKGKKKKKKAKADAAAAAEGADAPAAE